MAKARKRFAGDKGYRRGARGGKKDGSKDYFNKDTEDAIARFLKMDPETEKRARDRLFREDIMPKFHKMAECMGRHLRLGWMSPHVGGFNALVDDCVVHLYEKMHLFDPARGFKAFSYFNVVTRHYLIGRSKKVVKELRDFSLDDDHGTILEAIEAGRVHSSDPNWDQNRVVPSAEEEAIASEDGDWARERIVGIIAEHDTESNVAAVARAVHDLHQLVASERDDDMKLNKRTIYEWLRRETGLEHKELQRSLNILRRDWRCDD